MRSCKQKLSPDQVDAIARAVADPRRFSILQSIAACETTPCGVLREQHPISAATISHHMKELADAGLITIEREGRTARLTFQRDLWNAYLQRLSNI